MLDDSPRKDDAAVGNASHENLPRWWGPVLLIGLGGLAWSRRFILDDAFISFRYAEHLAAGQGLVWNVGEWVEGYTNFAWTLWMTLAFVTGLDPVTFAQCSGLCAFVVAVMATGDMTRTLTGSRYAAMVAMVLLGMTPTFNAYATGGLETSSQAALLTLAGAIGLRGWRAGRLSPGGAAALSTTLALAVWTRMDSAAIGCAIGLSCLALAWRQPGGPETPRRPVIVALIAPFTVLVGGWLVWKLNTYGDLLPNTYYAKTGAQGAWGAGLAFLWIYVRSSLLYPTLVALGVGAFEAWRGRHAPILVLFAALTTWLVYVVSVGGDFMEFRFLVAALPFAMTAFVWTLWAVMDGRALRTALVVWTLLGGLHHQLTFEGEAGVESIEQLASHLTHEVQDWEGIGHTLARELGSESSVAIATTAAGAIPYYSGLRTVDMLGLTDAWIARHGKRVALQIAHHRLAPLSYLVERDVNLVLGQPWLRRPGVPPRQSYPFDHLRELHALVGTSASAFPHGASIVEIPMVDNRVLVALYLVAHPDVDQAIAKRAWRRIPIVARTPNDTL